MDTVPSAKIAGIAHARVIEAQAHLKDVTTYSSSAEELKAARAALSIASELLALIAPPPQLATMKDDGSLEPFIPPAPEPSAAVPTTFLDDL